MTTRERHQELLAKYAKAIVKVSLNLRQGQRLVIFNAINRGVPPAVPGGALWVNPPP